MKLFRLLTKFAAFTLFSSATFAVQISVEDVSNRPPQCYDGSNPNSVLKAGECGITPKGTLQITVQLEGNEPLELLDNVHVVLENNGKFHQYGTVGGPTWTPVSIQGLMTSPAMTASFGRFPPGAPQRVSVREIHLDDFYTKGTKVHVGVRVNESAGFITGAVKEAFEIR